MAQVCRARSSLVILTSLALLIVLTLFMIGEQPRLYPWDGAFQWEDTGSGSDNASKGNGTESGNYLKTNIIS